MKNSKKGISLIVLVITIIVIVILATAILVSVLTNNPISEANKARYESDRDNMQAVFTNTVGKIMAENQGTVNVTAGQINTETTGVNETTGEVAYTVDNATVAANGSGKICFDKGTNTATTYYTGKKLPIYAAGETKWYVNSEGVLTLEVAGVKYGSGEISGSGSEEEVLEAGLYDENDNLLISWADLTSIDYQTITYSNYEREELTGAILNIDENGILSTCFSWQEHENKSSQYLNGKLVIHNSVKGFDNEGFWRCNLLEEVVLPNSIETVESGLFTDVANLVSVTIPNSVTKIESCAFGIDYDSDIGCNLNTINYLGTIEEWNQIQFDESDRGNNWYSECNNEIIVHCTDGNITLPIIEY